MNKLMLKYKWYLLFIILLMIIEPTINSVLNFWLQRLFNSATVDADIVYVLRLLTIGFLLWMSKRIVTHTMLIVRDRFICNMKGEIKHRMFKKLLFSNTAHISQNISGGEYISSFTNEILLLEQRYLNQIMGLISGIFSIAILGYSFVVLNAKLACVIIGFGALTMFVPFFFSKKLNGKNIVYIGKIATFTQKLKEYISAFPTIKNYSIEPEIMNAFDNANDDTENSKFEADCAVTLANSMGQLLAWFMQFIGVGLGIAMVIRGEILIGTVIAAQSFASDLALPIQNIIININSIRSVKDVIKKLESFADTFDEKPALTGDISKDGASKSITASYDIDFKSISLAIEDKKIIDDFSYCFESGKKYLIVGVNGSGKSSVFKILKKWYKSFSGDILINGISISEYSNEELSNIVTYLNENVSLFTGTLRDNISLFKDYCEEDMKAATEKSHIGLDLDRQIIDEGRNISSGEQRRVEIARSLLKSSSIFIFDEVASTLDIETAYEIEKFALELADKTVIFVSHNFSGKLIREYDKIIVMKAGSIMDSGTYEELIERCPYFKNICEIKFG